MTKDATVAARSLLQAKRAFVSPGVVSLPKIELGYAKSFLVSDPDGHVMQLIEK